MKIALCFKKTVICTSLYELWLIDVWFASLSDIPTTPLFYPSFLSVPLRSQPPPNLPQRPPQQILPPLIPIPLRLALLEPNPPNHIQRTRLHQLPLSRRQHHLPQILRVIRRRKLIVIALLNDLRFIYSRLALPPLLYNKQTKHNSRSSHVFSLKFLTCRPSALCLFGSIVPNILFAVSSSPNNRAFCTIIHISAVA